MESGNIFGREPALVLAAVQAGLALLVGFGLNLDGQQVALIMGFAAAVVSLIVRRRVAPSDSASDQ